MLASLKATIAALIAGLAALLWALVSLQSVFTAERDEAMVALELTKTQAGLHAAPADLAEESARINKRYRIKSRFLVSCAMLGLIMAALAILAQWRKARIAELKSDFVATVSHELKTPLASIRLLAETMERGEELGQATPGYPRKIVDTVDQLSALVENILSFNRLGKDGWRLRKSAIDLEEVAAWAEEEAGRVSTGQAAVEVLGLEGVRIEADPDLVRLLIANLARNAILHNPSDDPRISLSLEPKTAGTVLLFSDNGPGIAEKERKALFTEFHKSANGPGKARGAGLGLAICHKIMLAHGGSISIHSSGPAGTTFRLLFP